MGQLTESTKILLAKLYFKDIERYQNKIKEFDIEVIESEMNDYIAKEKERLDSLKNQSNLQEEIINKDNICDHTYYLGGKPYWCEEKVEKKIKTSQSSDLTDYSFKRPKVIDIKKQKDVLILVDGDNHIYEALDGYKDYDSIKVFIVENSGKLKKRIEDNYGLEVIEVKPGKQAVDNSIKTKVGNIARKNDYDEIIIISHDNGYKEYIKKLNRETKIKCKVKLKKRIKDI